MKNRTKETNKDNLRLLENGLCFILQSIKHFEDVENSNLKKIERERERERELKYSTLHLCSGISLVLKERLRREHWSLLFSDINKANKKNLQSGDFYGVNFKDCLKRLSEISSIQLKDNALLKDLRKKRNKIEHFFEPESLDAFKSTVAGVLSFMITFIDSHLEPHISKDERNSIEEIRKKCLELKEFVEERLKQIEPKLKSKEVVIYCSDCGQKAIVPVDDDKMKCLFCPKVITESQYYQLYRDSVTEGWHPIKDMYAVESCFCRNCDEEDCLVWTQDKKRYFCLYCHNIEKAELFDHCANCNTLFKANEEGKEHSYDPWCSNCWNHMHEKY